ncbi:MAG: hypothetical protein PHD02_01580 [Bacilli bacterium]|nr:hypothetical protein [Bacilli bacterium]
MKLSKFLVLLLFLFLLSGCTINYQLEINDDLTVTETFKILNDSSYFAILGDVQDVYKTSVDKGMFDKGYKYSYYDENYLYGVDTTRTFNSLSSFVENSPTYKELYDDISIVKNDNIVIINSVGELNVDRIVYSNDVTDSYISIKLPFVVTYNNADRIDSKNNIYYWDINADVSNDKSIQLSFDKSKKKFNLNNFLSGIDYTFVLIIAIIIIGILVYNDVKIKNKNNNNI